MQAIEEECSVRAEKILGLFNCWWYGGFSYQFNIDKNLSPLIVNYIRTKSNNSIKIEESTQPNGLMCLKVWKGVTC
jgi:hypothetical protein